MEGPRYSLDEPGMTYATTPIADMDRDAARVIAAMDLPRGTQPLGPWREGLRATAEAERREDAGDAR